MLDNITGIAYLVVILSVLVIVHEWGHFVVAKLCGMRVEDFSLFFGPRLIRLGKRGDTEYNIRCFPLGGFVKIAGMDPDDVSGGRPILDAIRNPRFDGPHGLHRMVRELDSEAFFDLDPDNVSQDTRWMMRNALGPDGLLSESGRDQLELAQADSNIHEDGRKLIRMVLMADSRAKDPGLYSQKPIYQRALTIFAGPFMSLLFGYVVFCVMGVSFGLPNADKPSNQVMIVPGERATRAGIRTGDRIVAIDGKPTPQPKQIAEIIHHSIGKPLLVNVRRGADSLTFAVTPESKEATKFDEKTGRPVIDKKTGKAEKETIGVIGVSFQPVVERHNLVTSVKLGTGLTKLYLFSLLSVFHSFKDIRDNVTGPVGMAQAATALQHLGAEPLVLMGAAFSLCLGIMNLLPIPVLDGGHLLLLLWEKVRRRRLTPREVYRAQMVGLAVIAAIAVLVMYNDISRIVTGHGFQ